MDPLTIGLITGGANLLSGMFSSSTSASNTQAQIQAQQQMQAQSQQFNAEQSQINRDWQQQMSNTAYQRASSDMKAAGLNPMMMFGSGSAASTPGDGAASSGTPNVPMGTRTHPLAGLGDAVGKVVSSSIQAKTFDKMTDEIANLKATRDRLIAETATEEERRKYVAASTDTEKKKPENIAQQTTAMKLDRARQEFEAIKYLDLSHIPDGVRKSVNIGAWGGEKASRIVEPLLEGASTAIGARRLFNDIWRDRASHHSDTKFYKGGMATESWKQ